MISDQSLGLVTATVQYITVCFVDPPCLSVRLQILNQGVFLSFASVIEPQQNKSRSNIN